MSTRFYFMKDHRNIPVRCLWGDFSPTASRFLGDGHYHHNPRTAHPPYKRKQQNNHNDQDFFVLYSKKTYGLNKSRSAVTGVNLNPKAKTTTPRPQLQYQAPLCNWWRRLNYIAWSFDYSLDYQLIAGSFTSPPNEMPVRSSTGFLSRLVENATPYSDGGSYLRFLH